MDLSLGPQYEAFRLEVRGFIEAHRHLAPAAGGPRDDAARAWQRLLIERGYTARTIPQEFGGAGKPADLLESRIIAEEFAAARVSPGLGGQGISMLVPTLLELGTDEQKRQFIAPTLRGEMVWCQGYSEPGAGSDLAALRTSAVLDGDHWVVNGQKIWTSGAQYSDWCGCLVRTDPTAKKHDGITFLLVDMHQPGIETRPIALIAGASPFCETFFTNARADTDAVLGKLNNGWTVGKRLLQHERASQTGAPTGGARGTPLPDMAKAAVGVDADGRLSDLDLRTRLSRHQMDAKAHGLTLARAAAEARGSSSPSNAASVLKNSATVVAQTRAELTLEIMGYGGLGWGGEGFTQDQIDAVRGWLSGKAMSIYGGSVEIQNNIISKRILGLPDTTAST